MRYLKSTLSDKGSALSRVIARIKQLTYYFCGMLDIPHPKTYNRVDMEKTQTVNDMTHIGRTAKAHFPDDGARDVLVKIDTGADSSSIWASDIFIDDEYRLHFTLFAEGSPYYSGARHMTSTYKVSLVQSSTGHRQVRYRVWLTVVLAGRRVRGSFTLADRSHSEYPVLIGCKLLNKKFLVDVSRGDRKKNKVDTLNRELRANPKQFFEKYHLNEGEV